MPVLTSKRKEKENTEPRPRNISEVPRVWYNLPSLLLSNVTSLTNKMEEVTEAVRTTNCDVMAITEAWQIVPEVCNIENFALFHHLRVDRRGGGVALFCRDDLSPSHLGVDVPEGVEALWVRVNPHLHPRHTASVIVCVVYHPPRAPTAPLLINHIIETADQLRLRFPASKLIVCGDFNRLDISEIAHHLNLTQVVNFPTHEQATLDLILTDMAEQYSPPRPLPPLGRSTHITILWTPAPSTSIPRQKVTRHHRPMPDSAKREFGRWIIQHPWNEVLDVEDVETKWNNYTTTTTEAFTHFFPLKNFSVDPSDAPWMTPRLKRLIKQRNRAYYTNRALFRSLRNKVIREIRAAKSSYYPNKLHHLKQQDSSKWFSRIKAICGLQKQTSTFPCTSHLSPDLAAQEINTHFASICQSLPPLDPTLLPAYLPSPLTISRCPGG